MQVIENLKIKEKVYIEKLSNGLTVMIIPKSETTKKYIIWGTRFGSIDNKFLDGKEGKQVEVPDGVAHFLEHKLFEQENGTNSLDVLSNLGVNANAYTTDNHTAYLYECTENFYEALDEFMDYVQHPYFTDENVEKEKGIIGQEINMYADYPEWQVYMNALDCLYENNPIKVDTAGSIESIAKIDKEMLYTCYNTFYTPNNMVLVVSGDFDPEELLNKIKSRLIDVPNKEKIERIYPEESVNINKKMIEINFDVNTPLFVIGLKDKTTEKEQIVKRHIAVEIILNMLIGKSSECYQQLYKEALLQKEPDLSYEFTQQYAHVLIIGQSKDPKKLYEIFKQKIAEYKEQGLNEKHFERIKKKIYGDYVREFDNVDTISRMFLADYFKGINSFDYIEQYTSVTLEYTQDVLQELFDERNMIISIVKGENK